jgi:hypothetical protein
MPGLQKRASNPFYCRPAIHSPARKREMPEGAPVSESPAYRIEGTDTGLQVGEEKEEVVGRRFIRRRGRRKTPGNECPAYKGEEEGRAPGATSAGVCGTDDLAVSARATTGVTRFFGLRRMPVGA